MVDEKAIEPHVALWEKYVRDTGAYPRSDFIYDKASDSYSCPGGKELKQFWRAYKTPRSDITKANTRIYRSRNTDCAACDLKDKCCPGTPVRKMTRSALNMLVMSSGA